MSHSFCLVSLGCPRNTVDSEIMAGLLIKKGYTSTPDAEQADLIIINTCGFLYASRKESVQTIKNVLAHKKEGAKVVVTGCLLQVKTPEFDAISPEIHYQLSAGDLPSILEAVTSTKSGARETAKSFLEQGDVPRILSTPPHYAYLKIAEGCRKRCAYCIIPHIKGPLQSKPVDQILSEITALLANGVREIILIAQDLGDWGKDLKKDLTHLLRKILSRDEVFCLRLLYLYPDEITDELIQLMKSDPRLLPYLDMPLQHVNDDLLRAMRRTTSKEQIVKTIATLRQEIPSIAIRTSLIVGFPGETEEQFEELCSFVKGAALDHVGIFAYSNEPLSHSYSLPNQIPEEIKAERVQTLAKIQQAIVKKRHRKLMGKRLKVMVDGFHPETKLLLVGHTAGQCPEVDSQVLIQNAGDVSAFGTPYLVEITGVSEYDLVATVLTPCEWP